MTRGESHECYGQKDQRLFQGINDLRSSVKSVFEKSELESVIYQIIPIAKKNKNWKIIC